MSASRFVVYQGNNWKVGVGGNGPIRFNSRTGALEFAKLRTGPQVERSEGIADSLARRRGVRTEERTEEFERQFSDELLKQ